MRTIWKLASCLSMGAMCSFAGLVTVIATDDRDHPLERADVIVINENTHTEVHKTTDRWGRAYLGWMDTGSYVVAARYQGEPIAQKALSITPKPIEIRFKRARLSGVLRPPLPPMERLDRVSMMPKEVPPPRDRPPVSRALPAVATGLQAVLASAFTPPEPPQSRGKGENPAPPRYRPSPA